LKSLQTPKTHHSTRNYFDGIFQNWNSCVQECSSLKNVTESNRYHTENWKLKLSNVENACLCGYFQNHAYISQDFCSKLSFHTRVLERYPRYTHSAFLHIRGGDYVGNGYHFFDLRDYYRQAIQQFPEGTHFYIFTNDRSYASSFEVLKTIEHTFVEEHEEDSLYLMSQCGLGGICANSTFSWWGAYLNPNRRLILPSQWFHDTSVYIGGLFFPGCIVI